MLITFNTEFTKNGISTDYEDAKDFLDFCDDMYGEKYVGMVCTGYPTQALMRLANRYFNEHNSENNKIHFVVKFNLI